jgi:aminopeptidase N
VGDKIFKAAVKNYLTKFQFGSAETSDFIREVEKRYGRNLNNFKQKWILNKTFPVDEAIAMLQKQSPYVQEYIMIDCEVKSGKCNEYLKFYASDDAKVKVISQAPELITEDTFKQSLKVRQAISQYLKTIPKSLKAPYETLLDDASYITIENALYNLWVSFPEDRPKYLAKTRGVYGFNDFNVRLLWIVLNLNTPFYEADNKQGLYNELVGYTDEGNTMELRMNAFRYLNMIGTCDAQCKSNLENAKTHHNWRMVKFAKDMSKQLEEKKQ